MIRIRRVPSRFPFSRVYEVELSPQAIPIFECELAYKAEHGADALLALWEAEQVPFWDPGRSPVPM
jgi:hypothetical protein